MSTYNIGIIVYASNMEAAIRQADEVGEGLAEQKHFSEHGETGKPFQATSSQGKEVIESLFADIKNGFMWKMAKIREMVKKYSDEELFEETPKELDLFKHYMWDAGRYSGPGVCLYDNDGEGIRDSDHLKNALEKWAILPDSAAKYDGLDVWVVPAKMWN